jgi:hypothetical protein
MIRPPTPGSHRTSTTRPPSDQKLIGPRTHHRSISSVKAVKAVSGATPTSTSDDTVRASLMVPPRRAA